MTNISFYLDFLIALVFILAICSNIMSVSYEAYAYFIKQRGKFLKKVIADVLNDIKIKDANIAELLYNHPQIDLTKKNYRHIPSYISSSNFAQTLIEVIFKKLENKWTTIATDPETGSVSIVKRMDFPEGQLERFKLGVADLPASDLKTLLQGFVNNSENKIEKLQSNIENWYDEYMNRASGWYKMIVQKRMIVFSFLIAIIFNMDFFRISTTLLTDKETTKQIASAAENYKPDSLIIPPSADTSTALLLARKQMLTKLYELNAPVGWAKEDSAAMNISDWLFKILGWLITSLALSFGAPFWFDILAKLINIRKTGVKPQTTA